MTRQRRLKYKNKLVTEAELSQKLMRHLTGIVFVSIAVILGLAFFAPKIGSFFGLFSKHRNDPAYKPSAVVSTPVFPDPPTAVSDTKVTLKGYAQPGATIKLYVNGPEKEKTTADNEGFFEFIDIKLISGKNTIFGRAVDISGNESDKSESFSIVVDKDEPEVEITSPKDGSTVKNLNKRVKIEGTVNEKTTITVNDRPAIQRPDFSFEYLLGVSEGSVEIKVVATDEAGNSTENIIKINYVKQSS